jgi:hypothetical protein
MSGRLLRDGNQDESSVNPLEIVFIKTPQIIEGGCYQPAREPPSFKSPPNLEPVPRRWFVLVALALIGMFVFALWRYFSRK